MSVTTIDFAPELFNPLFYRLKKADTRFVINYGGSGSGKSFTQTQHEVIKAIQRKETILVTRKYASTLKHSVIALTRRILIDWNLAYLYTENKSDQVFTFAHNGSQIIFKGLDDTEKIKSIAGITRIWMEEANEFAQDDFNQLNLRLRGRENLQLTMTFNPIDENHWIKKLFFDAHQYEDQTTILKTTYKDNRFIDEAYTQELERYSRIDENYHRIYALGEWGVIDEARIFPTWEYRDFPEDPKLTVVFGLDFGYSQDPTAVCRTTLKNGDIYLDEVIYQTGLNNADIVRLIRQDGYHGEPVVCDSAEPKSIDDLKRMGIKALPADKGKGSVNAGIDFLKRNVVYVSPRSKNIERENLHYRWKKDRMGNFLPVPEDAHNHCFAWDTLILTPTGVKKISSLSAGEYIINSFGKDKILWAGSTNYTDLYVFTIYFINFKIKIECTKDHLFYTDEGWKQIINIREGNRVFLCRNLMGLVSAYTREKDIIQETTTGCTDLYGSIITGKSPTATMFTTKTGILIITVLKTLKSFWKKFTCRNTGQRERSTIRNGSKNSMTEELKKRQSGTEAKMGMNGTSNMQKNRISENLLLELDNASCAKLALRLKQIRKGFAPISVNQNSEENQESIILDQCVSHAEMNLHSPNMTESSFVRDHVVQSIDVTDAGKKTVYNLEIENVPEYIANGVLVHNCIDAARYSLSLGLHERRPQKLDGVFF